MLMILKPVVLSTTEYCPKLDATLEAAVLPIQVSQSVDKLLYAHCVVIVVSTAAGGNEFTGQESLLNVRIALS